VDGARALAPMRAGRASAYNAQELITRLSPTIGVAGK
jgi:hypothetical protein